MMIIHVRYEGRSLDLTPQALGLDEDALRRDGEREATERALRDALARRFDVARDRFDRHVIDRPSTGDLIVRPEAVYG